MATPSSHWSPSNPHGVKATVIALSLITVLIFAAFPLWGGQSTRIFALHSDQPAAVVEAIRGIYSDRAVLVLAEDRLVVSADDQVIEQIADLLAQLDPEPRRLLFTIDLGPIDGNRDVDRLSTRSTALDRQQLHGVAGVPVVLSRVRVTERPVLGPWTWWVAFEDVPEDVDSITLVATVQDQVVTLDTHYRLRRGGQWQVYRTTVSGALGAWFPLSTGPGGSVNGRRALSTSSGPNRSLSVKVEDARQ